MSSTNKRNGTTWSGAERVVERSSSRVKREIGVLDRLSMARMEVKAGKMERQLHRWEAQLGDLAGQADALHGPGVADLRQRIDNLRTKHAFVDGRLKELRATRTTVGSEADSEPGASPVSTRA